MSAAAVLFALRVGGSAADGSAVVAPQASAPAVVGGTGIGDPYFPKAGNGGYQVDDYDLSLRYEPSTAALSGTAVVRAVATSDLTSLLVATRTDASSSMIEIKAGFGNVASTSRATDHPS